MLKGQVISAVGTMSGTSLDGVDAAVLETDGQRILQFGASSYRAYSGEEQQILRAALGRWPGEPGVAAAADVVEAAHLAVLREMPGEIIGFHGQSVTHRPREAMTLQIGDAAALAKALGNCKWRSRLTNCQCSM